MENERKIEKCTFTEDIREYISDRHRKGHKK
jgi:hypothetical protein